MRIAKTLSTIAALALIAPALAALVERKPPYYASITAAKARMRTGPGRVYPASWIYRRAGLPVKVIGSFNEKSGPVWRKIEDPDGTQGWMQSNLISDSRTAMVTGVIAELKDTPRVAGKVQWRAAPGVVGRIGKCRRGWCWFDVHGRAGYVEISHLWGVEASEALE
ncbi:SH3 domain-containing protein [uncultured Sphingomonas sp.]|uniref:SH3 domain-containing protein n=1 Tax=uncultured Sphingomonas sp. TaxID=158754 RepID=UPI0035C9A270